MAKSKNLDTLVEVPALDVILSDGSHCSVSKITIGLIPAFTKLIQPLVSQGVNLADIDDQDAAAIVGLFSDNMDQLIDFIGLLTKIERARLNEYDMEDFVKLVAAIVEVNFDFFIQRVLPTFRERATALEKRIDKIGQK